jgi:sporulation protein YlmC with PRC-barrel domain
VALGLGLAVDGYAQTAAPSGARGDAPKSDAPKSGDVDRSDRSDRSGAAKSADRKDTANRPAWTPDTASMEMKRLVGTKVRTTDGKDVGEIDQFIVALKDGKVSHVVIGMGGFAGVGERKVVVPWNEVKIGHDMKNGEKMAATIDSAALDRAPRYAGIGGQRQSRDRDRDGTPAASPATGTGSGSGTTGGSGSSTAPADSQKKN